MITSSSVQKTFGIMKMGCLRNLESHKCYMVEICVQED